MPWLRKLAGQSGRACVAVVQPADPWNANDYHGRNRRIKKDLETGTDVVYIYDGWPTAKVLAADDLDLQGSVALQVLPVRRKPRMGRLAIRGSASCFVRLESNSRRVRVSSESRGLADRSGDFDQQSRTPRGAVT